MSSPGDQERGLPEGFPIPLFPGSVVDESFRTPPNDPRHLHHIQAHHATASYAQTKSWYSAQLTQRGWKRRPGSTDAPGFAMIFLKADDEFAIDVRPMTKGAKVFLIYEPRAVSISRREESQHRAAWQMEQRKRTIMTPFRYQKQMATPSDQVHADFDKAFINGSTYQSTEMKFAVQVVDIGKVSLPSGAIVAADPTELCHNNTLPFAKKIAPGIYPVKISVAKFPNEERVAAAKIQFSDANIDRWEMALRPGEQINQLEKGHSFMYSVDSGTGCFVDADTLRALSQKEKDSLSERTFKDRWEIVTLKEGSSASLVSFSSGMGDGAYTSWWGLTKNGSPTCLITDFALLVEPIETEIIIDRIMSRLNSYLEHPLLREAGITVRLSQGPTKNSLRIESNNLPECRILEGKNVISKPGTHYSGEVEVTSINCTTAPSSNAVMKLKFVKGLKVL